MQVHAGVKDTNYFYEANASVSPDANFNITGIMRALEAHAGKGNPLPPTLFVYSDQGEKCMAMLLALGEVSHIPSTPLRASTPAGPRALPPCGHPRRSTARARACSGSHS